MKDGHEVTPAHPRENSSQTTRRLSDLKPRDKAIIARVKGDGAVRRRMMDMGLTTGAEILVVRVAPLGDPIEFIVRGYSLSLRKSEAANVDVRVDVRTEDVP